MWALLIGPLKELLQWLIGAIAAEAKAPIPGVIVEPTPAEQQHAKTAADAAASFPGIGKP